MLVKCPAFGIKAVRQEKSSFSCYRVNAFFSLLYFPEEKSKLTVK
jgi:hypothetical protein